MSRIAQIVWHGDGSTNLRVPDETWRGFLAKIKSHTLAFHLRPFAAKIQLIFTLEARVFIILFGLRRDQVSPGLIVVETGTALLFGRIIVYVIICWLAEIRLQHTLIFDDLNDDTAGTVPRQRPRLEYLGFAVVPVPILILFRLLLLVKFLLYFTHSFLVFLGLAVKCVLPVPCQCHNQEGDIHRD